MKRAHWLRGTSSVLIAAVGLAFPAPVTAATATSYLETLSGQPYYVNSNALCWQLAMDGKLGPAHSKVNAGAIDYPCKPLLSRHLTAAGQSFSHNLTVLVTATASKNIGVSNSVTMDYDLNGDYLRLSGEVGLLDNPFNRDTMQLEILGDGRLLTKRVMVPGSLPGKFSVGLAHVAKLTLRISNISGDAPNWDYMGNWQYSPGAVMIAKPVLKL